MDLRWVWYSLFGSVEPQLLDVLAFRHTPMKLRTCLDDTTIAGYDVADAYLPQCIILTGVITEETGAYVLCTMNNDTVIHFVGPNAAMKFAQDNQYELCATPVMQYEDTHPKYALIRCTEETIEQETLDVQYSAVPHLQWYTYCPESRESEPIYGLCVSMPHWSGVYSLEQFRYSGPGSMYFDSRELAIAWFNTHRTEVEHLQLELWSDYGQDSSFDCHQWEELDPYQI